MTQDRCAVLCQPHQKWFQWRNYTNYKRSGVKSSGNRSDELLTEIAISIYGGQERGEWLVSIAKK